MPKEPKQTGTPTKQKSQSIEPLPPEDIGFQQIEGQKITAQNTLGFLLYFNQIMPDPDEMLKTAGIPITGLKNLTYDPRVFSACEQRVAKTKSKKWTLDKGKAKSGETKLYQKMYESLDIYNLIDQASDSWKYGYKLFEVVKEFRDGLLWPKVIAHPPEYFRFDGTGKIQWLRISSAFKGVDLPEGDYILLTNRGSQANPYGEKVLSRVFWWVTFKREMVRYRQIMGENFGMDGVWTEENFDANKKVAQQTAEGLTSLFTQRFGRFPAGVKINTIPTNGRSGSDIYQTAIQYDDNAISEAILTNALTQNTEQTGTYGSKMVGQENEYNVSDSDERTIYLPLFNGIGKIFQKDNFPLSSYRPEFCLYDEEIFRPDAQQIVTMNDLVQDILSERKTTDLVKEQMKFAFPGMEDQQIDLLLEKAVASVTLNATNNLIKQADDNASLALQRLYLPVNQQIPLLTADEAREIANRAGAVLKGPAPPINPAAQPNLNPNAPQ